MDRSKNCPICGKVFDGLTEVCIRCEDEDRENFQKVKDYLYFHPNANAVDVMEATGVTIKLIQRYLREERIVAVGNTSSYLLDCKICKKPINSGIYCKDCEREINEMKNKNKNKRRY